MFIEILDLMHTKKRFAMEHQAKQDEDAVEYCYHIPALR